MGLFGGDSNKGKDEDSKRVRKGGTTQRRSRKIVTPGQSGVQRGPTRRVARPSGPQQGGGQAPAKAKPQQPQPQQKAPSSGQIKVKPPQTGRPSSRPVAPQQQQGGGLELGGPAPGAGSKPIAGSSEPDFGGQLGAATDGGPSRSGDGPLLEFLVGKANLLTEEQAQQARQTAERDQLPIDVACTRLAFITEEQLVNALTQECWVPHLKVDKYEIRKKALDTISEADARRFSVLPVDKLGSILNLAMVNPLDVEAIRILESKTGLDIKKVVATRTEIDQGMDKYYGGKVAAKEDSIRISQDRETQGVTRMLSKVGKPSVAPETAASMEMPQPAIAAPTAPAQPEPAPAPEPEPVSIGGGDDVADIDDLLSEGEEVAPSIVEPITIGDDEIEPEFDPGTSDEPSLVSESGEFQPSALADGSSDALLAPEAESDAAPALTPPKPPSIGEPAISPPASEPTISPPAGKPAIQPEVPEPEVSEPAVTTPAAAAQPAAPEPPAPAPAKAPEPAARRGREPRKPTTTVVRRTSGTGLINLVPVMEEEFQHAITHGKARIFEKWVSLQTRNRILNAVPVEHELDGLLHTLYQHGEVVDLNGQ